VKTIFFLLAACTVSASLACGGSTPPPAAAPTPSHANDANRALSESECKSLGDYVKDVCENRGNERSERVNGWCSDLVRGVDNGTWVDSDCLKHIKYMDGACLRSSSNVHAMMDCDSAIDRSN
jgi:hypothetical protein